MILVSKEEILKLAQMSRLDVHPDEIEELKAQLEGVLTYAQRVQQISADIEQADHPSHNVVREDVPVRADSAAIVERCPQHEAGYFVVPAVLASKTSGE